jgi:hypothetical protein
LRQIGLDTVPNRVIKPTFFGKARIGGHYSGPGTLPGAVVNEFAHDVHPGNIPTGLGVIQVRGGAIFDSTAQADIQLGSSTPGSQYDQIHVTGHLKLGGTLNVALINGFSPAAGNSFDILDGGTLAGTFETLSLPMLANGLTWNFSQL